MSNFGETGKWYAVQTRSNFEKRVALELQAKGFDSYCPVFQEVHNWADRKKLVERPVFSGYTFVRSTDAEWERLAVIRTNGVARLLGANGKPEEIPEHELDPIRRMLASGLNVVANPFLRTGTWVRIRRGVLRDVEGILVRVKNSGRLVLSINLLCQSVAAEVDLGDVEVIHAKRTSSFEEAYPIPAI